VDTDTAATLGLSVGLGTDGVDVAGTLGGVSATGSGRTLTGSGDAIGLAVEIQGGSTGDRGTIAFSRGVADKLDSLLSDLLDSDGSLSSETDGVNASIKDIDKQRDALSTRLASLQDRYMKQFIAMDALVGQMKATSSYLTQQLASLPGVSSSSSSQ
jgi:flagellar hook-associated protein 2